MVRKTIYAVLLLMMVSSVYAQDEVVTTRSAPPDPEGVRLVAVVTGFDRPLFITHAGDGSGRLFVVEQSGRIWVVENDILQSPAFLDISELISPSVFRGGFTEQGLLGLAFHPKFAENGEFFVNYTDFDGVTNVVRYLVSADDPDQADPSSAQTILQVAQPFRNHNGGHLAFGPDGYLYIGFGDGGSAGDPLGNGQNRRVLLGSLLRLDIDNTASGKAYAIPAENPFADDPDSAPEIWAWGLRNPWRFSFDRATGDLYIGDVGQNLLEEINFQPADSPGGENYGWDVLEGSNSFSGAAIPADVVMPIAEYGRDLGFSVTGGYVYRGESLPELQGVYFYGDFGSGRVWATYRDDDGGWQTQVFIGDTGRAISSFGEDEQGELYLVDHGGSVLRFESTR
jgi:glucose/arabinose dehydrogenase